MSDLLIKGMEMPKSPSLCRFYSSDPLGVRKPYCDVKSVCNGFDDCPLVPIPPHGDLIDRDALIADLRRQCKEVFKTDAVSPDDFWISRDQAYNERLWTTWCESLFDYLKTAPTVIETEEGET